MTNPKYIKDLLPCPFCGSTNIKLTSHGPGNTGSMWQYGIWCVGCRAGTNWSISDVEAIQNWNTRFDLSHSILIQCDKLRDALENIKYNVMSCRAGDGDNRTWEQCANDCEGIARDALKKTKESM